jgi:hypothetical protein
MKSNLYNIKKIGDPIFGKIGFGYRSQFYIDNLTQEWKSFLNKFWKHKKFDSNNNEMFKKQLKCIFGPLDINNININSIKSLFSISDKKILYCLIRHLNLFEAISILIYPIFMKILKFHEKIVENCLIEMYGENRVNESKKGWENFAKKNNIHYSSSIMSIIIDPYKSNKYENIDYPHDIYLDISSKINGYNYEGFCSKKPLTKLIKLLEFPVQNFSISNKYIKHLQKINTYIIDIQSNIKKFKDVNLSENIFLKKITTIFIFKKLEPIVVNYLNPIEDVLTKISQDLQKINKIFDSFI